MRTSELIFALVNSIAEQGDLEIFVDDTQLGERPVNIHLGSYMRRVPKASMLSFNSGNYEEVACIFVSAE